MLQLAPECPPQSHSCLLTHCQQIHLTHNYTEESVERPQRGQCMLCCEGGLQEVFKRSMYNISKADQMRTAGQPVRRRQEQDVQAAVPANPALPLHLLRDSPPPVPHSDATVADRCLLPVPPAPNIWAPVKNTFLAQYADMPKRFSACLCAVTAEHCEQIRKTSKAGRWFTSTPIVHRNTYCS